MYCVICLICVKLCMEVEGRDILWGYLGRLVCWWCAGFMGGDVLRW